MGSKLPKLRAKAGVTGKRFQAEQRQNARVQERRDLVALDHANRELEAWSRPERALREQSGMGRVLADMSRRAREWQDRVLAGHIEPELARELAAAGVGWDYAGGPFHAADYLGPLEAKAFGLGEVCRVCGKERPAAEPGDITQELVAARLFSLIALATMGGLAVPPKGYR